MIPISLHKLFSEFYEIPRGILIDRPDELIETGFIVHSIIEHAYFQTGSRIFFTRRTLKHLSEKVDGRRLFIMIPFILKHPDIVCKGNKFRFLFCQLSQFENEGRYYVIVLESLNCRNIIIVTAFIAKEKYLKNFEILWRTAAS
jgi:hypothetical protein